MFERFVYMSSGQEAASYLPEDVVWMRYFNPLEEYAGLSPIAPLRLSADMGLESLRASPERAAERQRSGDIRRDSGHSDGR